MATTKRERQLAELAELEAFAVAAEHEEKQARLALQAIADRRAVLAQRRERRRLNPIVKVPRPRGRPPGAKDTKPRKPRTSKLRPVVLGLETARYWFAYEPNTGRLSRLVQSSKPLPMGIDPRTVLMREGKPLLDDMKDCTHTPVTYDPRNPAHRERNWKLVPFRRQQFNAHDIAYWCMGLDTPTHPPEYRNGDKYDLSWENIRP